MKSGTPESGVLKGCLQLLTLRRVLHYRQNSGAVPARGGGFRKFSSMKGLPDVVAIIGGRYVGVECKSPGGRQSPDQKAFQIALEAAGGRYVVVSDVRELERFLDSQASPPAASTS